MDQNCDQQKTKSAKKLVSFIFLMFFFRFTLVFEKRLNGRVSKIFGQKVEFCAKKWTCTPSLGQRCFGVRVAMEPIHKFFRNTHAEWNSPWEKT